ncbi:unnamed protein product [Urochloa decumbens]|uniref:Uncharacterized protein n=1 Tax=Urochloa decumbens TaxID=240449 RepID=A0ABC9E7Z0_9POAL
MALRSLVVALKALPRRMPGFGAFVPKGIAWSKSSARLTDLTKYGFVEETVLPKKYPDLHKIIIKGREASQRRKRVYNRNTVLIGIFGFGSTGYVAANVS